MMTTSRKIDLQSFQVKDKLNTDIWTHAGHIKPKIRARLIDIAQEFIDFLEIDVPIEDITFTGSLANYTWSEYSDIDLHVLIDFSAVDANIDLVRNLMMSKKTIWNDRFDVLIKGFEVELYAQDTAEPHSSTGVYSVMNDEWSIRPDPISPKLDLSAINEKAIAVMDMIDYALDDTDCSDECLDNVKAKIRRMRQSGLEKGGAFSVENLAFKALRRNGYIGKLYDISHKKKEDELSLEGDI